MQTFLRYEGPDNDKQLDPLTKESYEIVLSRYQELFPEQRRVDSDGTAALEFGATTSDMMKMLDRLIDLA